MLTPALLLAVPFVRRAPRVWLGAGVAWIAIVAVMAQAGFSGNPRYLIPGVAALLVCAAVATPRWLAVVMVAMFVAFNVDDLRDVRDDLAHRARVLEALEATDVPARCRPVRSGADERTIVARVLDQPIPQHDAVGTLVLSGERWTLRC
jgi:hypothetical protein